MDNCQNCLMLKNVRKLKTEQIQFVDSEDEPAYCRACYQREREENKRLRETRKMIFCHGFAYGSKYGYEGVLVDAPLPESEIRSSWLIASMLFDDLEQALKDKDV